MLLWFECSSYPKSPHVWGYFDTSLGWLCLLLKTLDLVSQSKPIFVSLIIKVISCITNKFQNFWRVLHSLIRWRIESLLKKSFLSYRSRFLKGCVSLILLTESWRSVFLDGTGHMTHYDASIQFHLVEFEKHDHSSINWRNRYFELIGITNHWSIASSFEPTVKIFGTQTHFGLIHRSVTQKINQWSHVFDRP